MRSTKTSLTNVVLLWAVGAVIGYVALRPFMYYARETVIVLMVPVLGGAVLLLDPRTRRLRPGAILGYFAMMALLVTPAVWFVSRMAGGRMLWREIVYVTWFALGWRLAWAVWTRTVGRAGQRSVRRACWHMRRGRRARRQGLPQPGTVWPWVMVRGGVPLLRAAATLLIFVPLFLSTVWTLRLKIADGFDPGSRSGLGFENCWLTTADGLRLHGWYIPEAGATSSVIICHGLGANKGNFFEFVDLFVGDGYNALIFDFRGHGASDGHTSGMGALEHLDVMAAVDWLQSRHPEGARQIFGLGSSMGAAALLRAASRGSAFDAIILDSCYASPRRFARHHVRRLVVIGPALAELTMLGINLQLGQDLNAAPPIDCIASLRDCPVLFIHAAADTMIPADNARVLYDRAPEPRALWLGPGTHSNVLSTDFAGYERRVLEFLSEHGR